MEETAGMARMALQAGVFPPTWDRGITLTYSLIICSRCLGARNGVGWNKSPVYQALPDLPDLPGLLVVVDAVVVAVAAAHLPLVRVTGIP